MVEDDSAVREMLRFVLLQNDYEVTEAGDVATAKQQIINDPPSLILLDWMLPGRSGIDFFLELKRDKRTSAIPVVMVTARGEKSDKVRTLETGADDYVTKPFSPRELVARIRAETELDGDFRSAMRRLSTFVMEDARSVGHFVDVVMGMRALERIGGHAKNIGGYVIFLVTGLDVRHETLESIESQLEEMRGA